MLVYNGVFHFFSEESCCNLIFWQMLGAQTMMVWRRILLLKSIKKIWGNICVQFSCSNLIFWQMWGAQTMMVWLPPTRQLLGTRPSPNVTVITIIFTINNFTIGINITIFIVIIVSIILKTALKLLSCPDKSKFEKRKLWVTSLGGVNAKLIAGL